MKDYAEVHVRCDDESHHGRTANVATFVRDANGWHDVGSPSTATWRDAASEAERRGVRLLPPGRQQTGYMPSPDDPHHKYDLRCSLCTGIDVRVREETIGPILDTLAGNQVHSVSLAWLAVKMSK